MNFFLTSLFCISAPRFRNSIAVSPYDIRNNRNSIISVSSSSSSGSSQSSFSFYGTLNLGFEPGDSPRPLHRSLTQQSQCSTGRKIFIVIT